jgi:hypothetical protein
MVERRYNTEQVIAKLRKADVELPQGRRAAEVRRPHVAIRMKRLAIERPGV